MMRLMYYPVNQAWGFVFGDVPIRMADGPLLYTGKNARSQAIADAARQGLGVACGRVFATGPGRDLAR